MNKLLQRIRFLGVDSNVNRRDNKVTILLNEMIIALLLLQSPVYVESIVKGEIDKFIIVLIVQLVTIVPLILSYFRKTQLAKWYFNLFFPVFMMTLSILHGPELRADFSFFIFGVTAILFFDEVRHRILLFSLIVFCYFFAIYYDAQGYPAPLAVNVTEWNSSIIFLAMMTCIALIVGRFTKESDNYEEQLFTLLNNLEDEQEKVESQNKELERANEDLEKFASMASHDLKSPLRNIGSFIQLIERKIKNYDDPDLKEYLGFVKVSTEQMSQLIEDVLEYSRVDSHLKETQSVKLEDILLKANNNLRSFIATKNVVIKHDALPVVQGYSSQLLLLFQNLIENGIKYNESETPVIKITYKATEEVHEIAFNDNGIGISEEYFNQIFEMFKRLHSSSEYEGSGVGLAICKKIVNAHDGEITIDSQLGKGTTFTICLPK